MQVTRQSPEHVQPITSTKIMTAYITTDQFAYPLNRVTQQVKRKITKQLTNRLTIVLQVTQQPPEDVHLIIPTGILTAETRINHLAYRLSRATQVKRT